VELSYPITDIGFAMAHWNAFGSDRSEEILDLLLKYGADVNKVVCREGIDSPNSDRNYWTFCSSVLELALENDQVSLDRVKMLVKKGARIELGKRIFNRCGVTPCESFSLLGWATLVSYKLEMSSHSRKSNLEVAISKIDYLINAGVFKINEESVFDFALGPDWYFKPMELHPSFWSLVKNQLIIAQPAKFKLVAEFLSRQNADFKLTDNSGASFRSFFDAYIADSFSSRAANIKENKDSFCSGLSRDQKIDLACP
jgi:hypothetical protein